MNIKVGDWVRHNYGGLNSIEIFKVGKVEGDKIYNQHGTTITQGSDYVYVENCRVMTPE